MPFEERNNALPDTQSVANENNEFGSGANIRGYKETLDGIMKFLIGGNARRGKNPVKRKSLLEGAAVTEKDELRDSLNGMKKFMTGMKTFDPEFLERLTQCLEKLDPKLQRSVNSQWERFKAFAESGGNTLRIDWVPCKSHSNLLKWTENNCTIQAYGNTPIWEPCNYSSNVAYYHSTLEICSKKQWAMPKESINAIGKSYASMALASALYHASMVEDSVDERVNDLITWIVYQEGIKLLPTDKKSIVHELSPTPRNTSAISMVDYIMNMYIESSYKEWGTVIRAADFPDLGRVMSAATTMLIGIVLPQDQFSLTSLRVIIPFLMDLFKLKISSETKEFITKEYIPAIWPAIGKMRENMPTKVINKLFKKFVGTMIKFLYAFLWQEKVVKKSLLLQPFIVHLGGKFLPMINDLASTLTSFEYSSPAFQTGKNFYPGQETWLNKGGCDAWNAHAKWHLQSGIALPDFAFVFDEVYRLINTYGI